MKLWWVILSLSAVLVSAPGYSENFVKADHKYFSYTGRIDFSDKKAPALSWPGSSIETVFTGNYLEVVLDDQMGKNYFNIIVDGEAIHPYVLAAKQGEHSYWISSSLGAGSHSLEIYKRTEGEEGRTFFKGIKIDDTAKLLPPPAKPPRRLEIYGDSISSGMGNEGAYNGEDHLLSEKNHYWAYGAIAARKLNAELHTISQSGIGIMISWFPFVMPQFYDQLDAVGDNDSQWNFTQWTPDLVLINLLQNDSWLIDEHNRLQPVPSDEQRIEAYKTFVKTIRAKYPATPIVCALGSMDATATQKWPDYIRRAVQDLRELGDHNLETLFFEFNGYSGHPRIVQHQHNAKTLVDFIRAHYGW